MVLLVWFGGFLQAQNPTTCFEIESILVDACGAPEGENEMVRFHIGPAPLNTASLTVNWPNNSWLGICQNATTAANVAQLNSTITSCGFLLEPSAGVLPAGATVILITSTNFNTAANSFATLNDTIYVIFQCQGNTTGHFANATGSGLRTLTMSFGVGCNDAVTYDCQQLVDINGNTGLGGSTTDRDGSTVNFTWANTASYVNYGCTAPFNPEIVNAGPDLSGCPGDTIALNGFVSNSLNSIFWSGGSGIWINPNQANAQYVIGMADAGTINLQLSANNCNGAVSDVMQVLVYNLPVINLNPSGIISICNGDTVTLDAGPGGPFTWNTGATTNAIDVFTNGIYIVSTNSSCGIMSDTAVVIAGTIPVATIDPNLNLVICPGNTMQLDASGGVNYLWNTSAVTSSITINAPGVYSVTVSNGCGSDTASVVVAGGIAPLVNITNGTAINICQGTVVNLSATGVGNIDWPGISIDSIIPISVTGNYLATATNSCGVDSAIIVVNVDPIPSITVAPTFMFCQNSSVQIAPVYVGNISWFDGSNAASRTINTAGNYFVVVFNSCGTDTAFFTVNSSFVSAGFSADSIQGAAPLNVNFTNNSINGLTYQWDFGNGDSSSSFSPSYTFNHPGDFLVVLSTTNIDGCVDTASMLIDVLLCDNKVFIPNSFTPNLDEVNPVFYVTSNCIQEAQVIIYNRWGQEVFSSTDISVGWDGNTQSGDPLPMGVYVYTFDYTDVNGAHHTYQGLVNLLR